MKPVRRVLVVQPFGLGDALFITPLLRALHRVPSLETVDLLLGSRTEPVFRNNPHVNRIFQIDKDRWREGGKSRVWRDLSGLRSEFKNRYDLLIDASLQREYSFYGAFLFGIPKRIGFDYRNRGTFLTHRLPLNGFEGRHAADFYCDLGKLIDLEVKDRFLEFYVSDEDRKEAESFLEKNSVREPFVAVSPGGGASWGKDAFFKRWPVENFSKLVSLLKGKVEFKDTVIVGSKSEWEEGSKLRHEGVVNLCGELSLGGAAALLEKARLFVGNDGGLVHLAHALRMPLVAFYGPADPVVYGPYPAASRAFLVYRKGLPCRPCYRNFRYNSNCPDRECLTALAPEEVMEQLKSKDFFK